jgi:anti-anti-sigma factor
MPKFAARRFAKIRTKRKRDRRLSGMPLAVRLFSDSFLAHNPERFMTLSPGPLLHASLEQGVLILTILQSRLQGEEIAHDLREEMGRAVTQAKIPRVVIDLGQVRYLSSVAFWPLLSLRKQLIGAGGRLIICGLSGDIEDVFATTKMISTDGAADAPFEVAPDVAAAVARLMGDS